MSINLRLESARCAAFLHWLRNDCGGDVCLDGKAFRDLAKNLGMTRSQVESTINRLAARGQIEVDGNSGIVIVALQGAAS